MPTLSTLCTQVLIHGSGGTTTFKRGLTPAPLAHFFFQPTGNYMVPKNTAPGTLIVRSASGARTYRDTRILIYRGDGFREDLFLAEVGCGTLQGEDCGYKWADGLHRDDYRIAPAGTTLPAGWQPVPQPPPDPPLPEWLAKETAPRRTMYIRPGLGDSVRSKKETPARPVATGCPPPPPPRAPAAPAAMPPPPAPRAPVSMPPPPPPRACPPPPPPAAYPPPPPIPQSLAT